MQQLNPPHGHSSGGGANCKCRYLQHTENSPPKYSCFGTWRPISQVCIGAFVRTCGQQVIAMSCNLQAQTSTIYTYREQLQAPGKETSTSSNYQDTKTGTATRFKYRVQVQRLSTRYMRSGQCKQVAPSASCSVWRPGSGSCR